MEISCCESALVIFLLCRFFFFHVMDLILLPMCLSVLVMWLGTHLAVFSGIFLRDYSYTMYLVHYPLVMLFVQYDFLTHCWILAFAAVLGITFTASCVLFRYLREP